MARQPVRIGARGSKLSVVQAESVRVAVAKALGSDDAATLVTMTTTGDRVQDRTLTDIGGKGLFTKEIEAALGDGRIDCAVHSLKDMPAESPPGLVIAATPEREDPRDAFVSARFACLADLPPAGVMGTASLRRQAQTLRVRPDLTIIPLRGNVDTRLARLERGEADAIILAAAGLNRLGLDRHVRGFIDPTACPPAPGQGALAVQTRIEDRDALWLSGLRHPPTLFAVTAERGALLALDGSCHTAIGAFGRLDGDRLVLVVESLSPDGRRSFRLSDTVKLSGASDEARAWELGLRLGGEVRANSGDWMMEGR